MDNIRPLPAREPLLPGESLASLIRRTTSAMGYDNVVLVRRLLKDVGEVPFHLNHLQSEAVYLKLSKLMRQSTKSLLAVTVHDYAQNMMFVASNAAGETRCDSKTIGKYFQSAHPPICPVCVSEDPQPYERLAWMLRALPVCVQHQCYLVDTCPQCYKQLRPDRLKTHRCRCGFDFRTCQSIPVSIAALRIFQRLAQWFDGDALPLTKLSCGANLWWLNRIASAIAKTPDWMKKVSGELAIPQSAPAEIVTWLGAAEILDQWPDKLFEFLDVFQQVTKHRTTATGLTRSFGLLLREAKQLEDQGFPAPADALRDYLIDHHSASHLTSKVCLFSAPEHQVRLENRPWISMAAADRQLRCRNGGSAVLHQRGVLEGTVRTSQSGRRTVGLVTRESVDRLAAELETAICVSQAGRQLGIGRSRVLELIHTNILVRAVRSTSGWQIPQVSINQWLDWIGELPLVKAPTKDWRSIQNATRQFGSSGLNLVRLIRLIDLGKVQAARTTDRATFRAMVVSTASLKQARSAIQQLRDEECGYPLNRLEEILLPERRTNSVVLKRWIDLELLHATRSRRSWVVSANEVQRFRAEFCLRKEAEQLLQIHGATLKRWIDEGEISPVYGPGTTAGGGFHLFRRAEVQRLAEFVRSHHRKWRRHRNVA